MTHLERQTANQQRFKIAMAEAKRRFDRECEEGTSHFNLDLSLRVQDGLLTLSQPAVIPYQKFAKV